MRTLAICLGILLAAVAIIYWTVPGGSLPTVFPGFESGSTRIHFKHGVAAAVVTIIAFALAWRFGRSRA